MSNCSKCGTPLDDEAKFCHVCGTPVPVGEAAAQAGGAAPAGNTTGTDAQNPQPEQPVRQTPPDQQGQQQNQQSQQNFYYGQNAQQGGPYQQSPYTAPVVDHPTISEVFGKSWELLKSKPMLLWGLSLLNSLLCFLSIVLGILPFIWIPAILTLSIGACAVYLDGYRKKPVSSEQLFAGFKNFWHCCGGMAWMALWIFIWGLIPVVGIVFAVIKAYSYRFTPYILLTQPEVSPTQALKNSMEQTEGYKGRMFGLDIATAGVICGGWLVLELLALIPYAGILFRIIAVIYYVLIGIFAPLVFGIYKAGFYDEISTKKAADKE